MKIELKWLLCKWNAGCSWNVSYTSVSGNSDMTCSINKLIAKVSYSRHRLQPVHIKARPFRHTADIPHWNHIQNISASLKPKQRQSSAIHHLHKYRNPCNMSKLIIGNHVLNTADIRAKSTTPAASSASPDELSAGLRYCPII